METATRGRPSTSAPSDGSRTLTITNDPTGEEGDERGLPEDGPSMGTLRLRGGPRKLTNRVAWNEDVVDNEGAGRKKSKICCIYHKPKRYDESSDESSDSDDERDHCGHNHDHSHSAHGQQSSHVGPSQQSQSHSEVHTLEPSPQGLEPNAYEKQHKGKRKASALT